MGLLGVLKAQAAFIPVDRDWPKERVHHILSTVQPRAVVTDLAQSPHRESTPMPWIEVPRDGERAGVNSFAASREQPMYAIYTSGSTGQPKAAVVVHRGIENRLQWMNDILGSESAQAAAQITSHVYDGAVWQVLWPLINGGKTVIPTPQMQLTGQQLAAFCHRHEVSILCFVPSLFNAIAEEMMALDGIDDQLATLRVLVLGGEAPSTPVTTAFKRRFPRVRILSMYGPTEASIGCAFYEVTGEEQGPIPLGKPIANTRILVLDEECQPVPIGVIGELRISGVCLGLGYLQDRNRTNEVFVPNPFAQGDDDRLMYNTGDMARFGADGMLEFLGRRDGQVKLRGFRIELGEIENTLRRHPKVKDAVAIVRDLRDDMKCLVSYVVRHASDLSEEELKAFAGASLPDHMVPSYIIYLNEIPTNSIGKVDRSRLPAPVLTCGVAEASGGTPLEQLIAHIWGKVLKLDRLSPADHFFNLGGHSILAVQAMAKLAELLDMPIALAQLFESPTVERFARSLESSSPHPQQLNEIAELYFELEAEFETGDDGDG